MQRSETGCSRKREEQVQKYRFGNELGEVRGIENRFTWLERSEQGSQ